MVYNIYRYIMFSRHIRSMGGWEQEQRILYMPIVLLVLFLLGYLAVGVFGDVDLVVAPILFGGSVFVLLMILFLQRVVGRVQENERLSAELKASEESNRAKSSFLSTMSHEIRTPMNAIVGLSGMMLKDPELGDDARDKVEKISAAADHLLALVNDVLDMSRIEAGKMTLGNEVFSLEDVLGQVNAIIGNQCSTKGLEYNCSVADGVDKRFVSDSTKLKQVLINILGNAVKFTPAPGHIRFETSQIAAFENLRTLRFVIADSGIGMDEDFLPKLFSVFSQEDATNTNRFGGSGLGMAITKNIVEQMNGEIQVQSKKGHGSTFIVTVTLGAVQEDPDNQAEPAIDVALSEAEVEEALDGLRVLMAEDVQLNADILADLLDLEGVVADHAENGQVAVDMFAASEVGCYDAVLMDMRMPVLDGLSAAKAIRALDRPDAQSVPIIALTANAFAEDMQRSLQASMNAHLAKPIDPDLLYVTLARLVRQRPDCNR